MHAGFQFLFSNFSFAAIRWIRLHSCIFDICKGWGIGYAIAKADPGFFNSPMTGSVAIATRDLRATCRQNCIESKFGETRVMLRKRSASKLAKGMQ